MVSKTLPLALFLAITGVFAVGVFDPAHQTQAAPTQNGTEGQGGTAPIGFFANPTNNPLPGETVTITVISQDPVVNIQDFYDSYLIFIYEDGLHIRGCVFETVCSVDRTVTFDEIDAKESKQIEKTYTSKIVKLRKTGQEISQESSPIKVSWGVSLNISADDYTPDVGQPKGVTITARTNFHFSSGTFDAYATLRIYEHQTVIKEDIGEALEDIRSEFVGSCRIGGALGTVCKKTVSSNLSVVKSYTADILIPDANAPDGKRVVASTEPITVVWGLASLEMSASLYNPGVDKEVTITAIAKETVQGTAFNIYLYEQGQVDPLRICDVSDRCVADVISKEATTKTYVGEVFKYIEDAQGNKLKVVQARGSVTVTWGEPTAQKTAPGGLVKCGIGEGDACTFCDFFALTHSILNGILKVVVPTIAVLMVAIGGFLLATSRGNPGQSQKGKDIIIWTFAGIAVISVGWIVLNSFLSGIGVMKWTGITSETIPIQKVYGNLIWTPRTDLDTENLGGVVLEITKSSNPNLVGEKRIIKKIWDENEFGGVLILPSGDCTDGDRVDKTGTPTKAVTKDCIETTAGWPHGVPGEGDELTIGGWWQFACGI